MHELLWAQIDKLEGNATAKRAICTFDSELCTYTVLLLGDEFIVNAATRSIYRADQSDKQAGFLEQLCVLAYLINASDIPVTGRLVGADKLDSGQFFFRGPHMLPTARLEEVFGEEPALLNDAGDILAAKRCEYGDTSIEIEVLPRLSIVIVIWAKDDEFDARASILFDETADKQLPLDALGAGVQLAVTLVINCLD